MFLIFKLLLYVTLAQKRQIEKEDAERWKRIERDREKSGFYLFHSKKRKDKPTFRTIVNFDKALNDPNHAIHRRIQKKNERRTISPPPTINSAVDIETETDRAFNYVLDLGPLHSNPLVISSFRNDDTTKESYSLHSNGNTIVIRDPKDIPTISDSTGIPTIGNSTDIPTIGNSTGIPTIGDSTGIAIISDSMGVPDISINCKSNKSDLLSSCSNSAVISVTNKQTNESMSLGSISSRIVTSDDMNSDDIKSNESMLSGSITNMGASNYSSFVINNTDNTKIIEIYGRLWNCEFSFRRFQIGTHPMHRQPGSGTNTSSRCGAM